MMRCAWAAVLVAILAGAAAAAAGAAEPTATAIALTVTWPAPGGGSRILVQGDTNLPDGSSLLVQLAYLGHRLCATRTMVNDGQFQVSLDAGGPLAPAYYDVLATYGPELQDEATLERHPVFTRVVTGSSFASAPPEEIVRARDAELSLLQEQLAQVRDLFDIARSGLAQRAEHFARFDGAAWSRDYAGWSDRVAEVEEQFAQVRRLRPVGVLLQAEEQVADLYALLRSLHRQIGDLPPFGSGVESPAPGPKAAEVLAALDARFGTRLHAVQVTLDREAQVGDHGFLVSQLRTLDALHSLLLHSRQRYFGARVGAWEELSKRWQGQLDQVQWNIKTLQGQEFSLNFPHVYPTFAGLPAVLQRLWDGFQRLAKGDRQATRQVQEADETYRKGFLAVVRALEMEELFPGWEGE